MERIHALVEQLDLAAEQLAQGTPVAARFALILCDNALELILHISCETEIAWDKWRDGTIIPPRYTERLRREVLGQHFVPKAKFCRALGMFSEEVLESIVSAHAYRNELYHSGIRYDSMILPLAWFYYGIACEVLPAMHLTSWRVVDAESPRVLKHLSRNYLASEFLREAATSLHAARPSLPAPFAKMLSAFAEGMVDDVEEALDFLTADNFDGLGEQEMLEHVQFHHYAFEDGDPPRVDFGRVNCVRDLEEQLAVLKSNWRPRYRTSPIARWRTRACRLGGEPNPHRALKRFQRLRDEMSYLGELLAKAASELDEAISREIDRRRGK